ncbi:CIC11C00000004128 [Sungouiella intermedia]|uniref:CIC11C00000004128 n=1 Tax=Sungouiella intermedia TaxID=45354 RepID=A0A1L0BG83_9ASCO|nr:CIC11C00000004128 [[Candida] intermedia]
MSIYQRNGQPLSQQALYQQKLRQGVYNSPGKPIVGVNSNASDAAALLAASSDLTVKPSYERLQAAPEAHNAALAARKEQINAWKREKEDPLADAAAASARTAEAVPRKLELGIPASYNKGSVYKVATSNSTSTMTSRVSPEKSVSKHGLASTSTTMTSQSLNIGKISQIADKNSLQLLNNRFNPENDYRSGIATQPAEFLTADQEKLAAQSAGRSLTMKHGAGYSDSVSLQKRTKTFQAADVVDATLLAAASAKAAERLNSIKLTDPSNLREQAQLYSKALATAQKNSEERLKNNKAGMIDLGGGLLLPIAEVDKLASLIVQPVLNDLNDKATAQRESDAKQKLKLAELLRLHQKSKVDDFNRKQKEKAERKQAEKDRIEANEGRKKNEDELYGTYQGERHTEVDGKTEELKELEEKYAGEKEALLTEKQDNEDAIHEEESGLIAERKEELEKMQAERDEELKPTLDELEVETGKLKDLTDSKNQLESEVASGEKLQEEYEAKIAELKEKLEQTKTDIETTTAELEETTGKRENLDKEVEELHTNKATEDENAEKTHKELDEQLNQLEKEKEEHITSKTAQKKEILLEIDDQVKDEHKINKELPEHLQVEIPESKFRDTGSLFTVEQKPEKVVEEKAVEQPKPKETVAAKVEPASASPKKGFRSRINSIKKAFKTPQSAQPAAKPAPATVASTLKKKEVEEEPKKLESNTSANKEKSSELSNYEEEISIKDDRSKRGGLFKEEI